MPAPCSCSIACKCYGSPLQPLCSGSDKSHDRCILVHQGRRFADKLRQRIRRNNRTLQWYGYTDQHSSTRHNRGQFERPLVNRSWSSQDIAPMSRMDRLSCFQLRAHSAHPQNWKNPNLPLVCQQRHAQTHMSLQNVKEVKLMDECEYNNEKNNLLSLQSFACQFRSHRHMSYIVHRP